MIAEFLFFSISNYSCILIYTLCSFVDYANCTIHNYFSFEINKNQKPLLENTLFLLFSSILYIIIILSFEYDIFASLLGFGNILRNRNVNKKAQNDVQQLEILDENARIEAVQTNLGKYEFKTKNRNRFRL